MKKASSIFGKMILMVCLFWTTQASTQANCVDIETPDDLCVLGTLCVECDGSFTFTGTNAATHVGFTSDDTQWIPFCNGWSAHFSGPPNEFCDQEFSLPSGTVDCDNKATLWLQWVPLAAANIGCEGETDPEGQITYSVSELFADVCENLELDHTNVLCQSPNGSVTVVGHPLPNHSYVWESNGVQVGTEASLECLPAGEYCVTVTNNDTGCMAKGCVTVDEVTSTIITASGGDTGLTTTGIKLAAGQVLSWKLSPLSIPDGMEIEWAPTPAFGAGTITLLETGPVTSFGPACEWSSYAGCANLLYLFNFNPGSPLPVNPNGPGINVLPPPGTAFANTNNNTTECNSQQRSAVGCVTVPESGWVRVITNPNLCGTTGTGWSIRIRCGCDPHNLQGGDTDTRSIILEKEPYFNSESSEEDNWIYPNPSIGLIYFNSESKISSVEVYDASGRLITQKSGLIESLDLTNENPGIYLVKMKGDFGEKAQKIIIQQ